MVVGVAAGAVLTAARELLVGVAIGAADALVEGEEALVRVLELDFGKGMPRGVAGLALAVELGAVGRRMAGGAGRLGLLVAMAVIADELGVAAFQEKASGGMFLDFVGRGLVLALDLLVQLDGQGAGAAPGLEEDDRRQDQDEGQAEDDHATPGISAGYIFSRDHRPHHFFPWHL